MSMVQGYNPKGQLVQQQDPAIVLWQVGHAWIAKKPKNLNEYQALVGVVEKLQPHVQGVIFADLEIPYQAWMEQRERNLWLANCKASHRLFHYISPLENGELSHSKEQPIISVIEKYLYLVQLTNTDMLIFLALDIDRIVETLLSAMRVDATAEYTLEALLKDFHNEVTSWLLKTRLAALNQIKQELCELTPGTLKELELEKKLLAIRQDLVTNLGDLKSILNSAIQVMHKTSMMHIDSTKITKLFILMRVLIEDAFNWDQKQIALQVLVKELNMSIITFGSWEDFKNIRLAALQNNLQEGNKEEKLLMEYLLSPQTTLPKFLKLT